MAARGYKVVGSEDAPSLADDDIHGRQGKKIKLMSRVKPLAFWLFILISVGMNFILLIKSEHRSDIGRSPFSKSSAPSFTKISQSIRRVGLRHPYCFPLANRMVG